MQHLLPVGRYSNILGSMLKIISFRRVRIHQNISFISTSILRFSFLRINRWCMIIVWSLQWKVSEGIELLEDFSSYSFHHNL